MPYENKQNVSSGSLGAGNSVDNCNPIEINYLPGDFVFSDETSNYIWPVEPAYNDNVKIFLRTARNNTHKAFIHLGSTRLELMKDREEGHFSYYYALCKKITGIISYYFSILISDKVYYYNKKGFGEYLDERYNFKVVPGFPTPGWAKGAVTYQIFIDRFYNGDTKNDVENDEYAYLSRPATKAPHWNSPVLRDDIANFYGGDIKGIMDKMGYLKSLGVEVILLNPVFVSPSSHKYDVQDYDYIDPHIGVIVNDGGKVLSQNKYINRYASKYLLRTTDLTNLEKSNELMIKFIENAHANNIKVILDGVFNHCGSFNKWLDKEGFYQRAGYKRKGAYLDKTSKYHNYFKWYDDNWPGNDAYDCWWHHLNHPKLNYEDSPQVYEKMLEVGRRWVSPPYNADGWRLDVAADLGYSPEFNHRFWKDFRAAVKNANPNALILAEHYGSAEKWLLGDEWDTIMNYDGFMEPVTWFFTGMEKHSDHFNGELLSNAGEFIRLMRQGGAGLCAQSQMTALNQLSNHDHSRFLTRTNKKVGRLNTHSAEEAETGINKAVMFQAVIMQMTWPGSPGIYYGDEAGLCGWTDPDNRRTFPWGTEDLLMINFHREAIRLRKKFSCLRDGSLEYLYNAYGILSYARWNSRDYVIVAVNNSENEATLSLPVWKAEIKDGEVLTQHMRTFNGSFDTSPEYTEIRGATVKLSIKPFSSIVLGGRK